MQEVIKTIPTQDILDELMERCAPVIFIGTKYEGETGDRSWKTFARWSGNLESCRGLCHEMDSTLQRIMIQQELGENLS